MPILSGCTLVSHLNYVAESPSNDIAACDEAESILEPIWTDASTVAKGGGLDQGRWPTWNTRGKNAATDLRTAAASAGHESLASSIRGVAAVIPTTGGGLALTAYEKGGQDMRATVATLATACSDAGSGWTLAWTAVAVEAGQAIGPVVDISVRPTATP